MTNKFIVAAAMTAIERAISELIETRTIDRAEAYALLFELLVRFIARDPISKSRERTIRLCCEDLAGCVAEAVEEARST